MSRKKFLLGNWKMNKVPSEALSFMEKAPEMAALASKKGIEIGVAPTFLCLEAVKAKAPKGFVVSAQNVNEHSSGAYTGEVSPLMLRAIGIDHAIIGHSERREYNGETSKACNLKIKALLAEGLTPVYCCGESLATYEAGETVDFVKTQIEEGFADLTKEEAKKVVVAYEPIWAISTTTGTHLASPDEISHTVSYLRETLVDTYSAKIAEALPILYGGSVNPSNAGAYLTVPGVNGLLVGNSSLIADQFLDIINIAKRVQD